jgi:hypothetical protein
MATPFKNVKQADVATGVGSTLFTVATNYTYVIIGMTLANTTASQIKVSMTLDGVDILRDIPIPSGATLHPIEGKLNAVDGDALIVICDTASACDATVSYMEST